MAKSVSTFCFLPEQDSGFSIIKDIVRCFEPICAYNRIVSTIVLNKSTNYLCFVKKTVGKNTLIVLKYNMLLYCIINKAPPVDNLIWIFNGLDPHQFQIQDAFLNRSSSTPNYYFKASLTLFYFSNIEPIRTSNLHGLYKEYHFISI